MDKQKGRGRFVFLCLAPAVILFTVFMVIPTINVFRMSLYKWGGYSANQEFVGLDNFKKIPNGCGGIEDRLHVLWHLGVHSGRISPEQFVALTSSNAAKTFNLWPRKGRLEVGADADVIVLDPERTRTLSAATQHQKTDFSVWEGMTVKGVVIHTLSRGRQVWADGELRAEPGAGRYLPRSAFGYVYTGQAG